MAAWPALVSPKDGTGLENVTLPLQTVVDALQFQRFAGTSLALPHVVLHPVSLEFPHQRTAFVTASQLPQRIRVNPVRES
jgi:hypothetical protein